MKEVQICQVIYKDIEVSPSTAPMIRGYFANKYKEIEEAYIVANVGNGKNGLQNKNYK